MPTRSEMRERFEAWAREHAPHLDLARFYKADADEWERAGYRFRETQDAWEAWQAAEARAASRHSLAQEIAEALTSRGFYAPKDVASSDLIGAVGVALEAAEARGIERVTRMNMQQIKLHMGELTASQERAVRAFQSLIRALAGGEDDDS